jgi:hypothetical protein
MKKTAETRIARIGQVSGKRQTRQWDAIARANPFLISPLPGAEKVLRKNYGENYTVVTHGELSESASRTWIAIKDLSPEPGKLFAFTITDIAKEQGLANPYDEARQSIIREDIEALLNVEVRIFNRKRKLRAKFAFLSEGMLEEDEDGKAIGGKVSISNFLAAMEMLGTGFFWLDKRVYYSLKSPLSRQLFQFLTSQRLIQQQDTWYRIGMVKLLYYIDCAPDEKLAPWQLWKRLKPACDELVEKGIIQKYEQGMKRRGGDRVVCFYSPAEKRPPEDKKPEGKVKKKTPSSTQDWAYVKDKIANEVPEELRRPYDEGELEKNLSLLDKEYATYSFGVSALVDQYLFWLKTDGHIKYFSPALLKVQNPIFQAFLESDICKTNLDWRTNERRELEERDKMKQRANTLEYEDERRKEKGFPLADEQRKFLGKQKKCPFGKRFGHDFNYARNDVQEGCWECKQQYDMVYESCETRNDKLEWDLEMPEMGREL